MKSLVTCNFMSVPCIRRFSYIRIPFPCRVSVRRADVVSLRCVSPFSAFNISFNFVVFPLLSLMENSDYIVPMLHRSSLRHRGLAIR